MRRLVVTLGFAAVVALAAAPAFAQVHEGNWFANASIGPSVGTFGSTPVAGAWAGYKLNDRFVIAGEFGMLPHASGEKASALAPRVSPFVTTSDVHVNGYHVNANLVAQTPNWGRFMPYVTGGFGTFTGTTVASASLPGSRVVQYSHDTNWATNLGFGTTYRLNKWFGLNADYRHFIVDAGDTEHVNRFATGVSIFLK